MCHITHSHANTELSATTHRVKQARLSVRVRQPKMHIELDPAQPMLGLTVGKGALLTDARAVVLPTQGPPTQGDLVT